MKRLTMLFVLALGLISQSIYAGERNGSSANFWDKLRVKIESLTPQKKLGVTTATGGVRGAPAATEDMYWKNDISALTIGSDELEAFAKAVKLTESDDKAQAQVAFSEFIKKFPAGALRKDADQALALLQNSRFPGK